MEANTEPCGSSKRQRTILLFSGGLDSTTLLFSLVAGRHDTSCLYIDYGHAAAGAEWMAASRHACLAGVDIHRIVISGLGTGRGEIPGRNAMLVSCAMVAAPPHTILAIGVHAGTGYRDCSPAFVWDMQRILDIYHDGTTKLWAPFLTWTKLEIHAYALTLGVPVPETVSCEAPTPGPCGRCRSCLDRKVIGC